jgi:membrane protein
MNFEKIFRKSKEFVIKYYYFIDELTDRIDDHHLYMLASGIAFNILLYMIPLFLLAIYVINISLGTSYISDSVENLFDSFMPPTESNNLLFRKIISEIRLILEHSAFFGWIGIIGLLWVSSALISSIRTSINAIFNLDSPKNFIIYKMKDILLTLAITILIFIYSYVIPSVNFVIDFIDNFIPDFADGFINWIILLSMSLFISFILFYFIFRFVPNKPMPNKIRFWSTVICMAAIESARHIFAWYISGLSNYGKFYGAYAVIVSLAVWIYYSSLILLLSAEITKFYFDKNSQKILPKKSIKGKIKKIKSLFKHDV